MLGLPQFKRVMGRVVLTLVVFVGIFMPCLIHVRMQYLVFAVLVSYIVWRIIKSRDLRIDCIAIRILVGFSPFLLYYSLLILYRVFTTRIDGDAYVAEYRQMISMCIYVCVLALAVSYFKRAHSVTGSSIIIVESIIAAGTLQLICVIASYLLPSVKTIFNDLTINNSYNETIVAVMLTPWRMSYRAYGLAENLFDQFGYVTSIIITITLAYGISRKSKGLILLACAMLIMPLLNARTGILLAILGMALVAMSFGSFRSTIKYILGAIIITACVVIVFDGLPDGLRLALVKGIEEVSGLLRGERIGVFSEIFGEDLVFPKSTVLGQGVSPERYGGYLGIDSGYIQCIWRYGVVGTVLLFGGFAHCLLMAYGINRDKTMRTIVVFLLVSLPVYCFKIFPFTSYSNLFIIFMFVFTITIECGSIKKQPLMGELERQS